jgi:small subunit ribosomal protein S16
LAVRLRLRRIGRKKLPIYKVVAADVRSPRDGRFIESVGQYEPLRTSNIVQFKEDRVIYWLKNGAQPTNTVKNLLQKEGLWLKWSLIKRGKDESTISEELQKFALQKSEREKQMLEKSSGRKKVKEGKTEDTKSEGVKEEGMKTESTATDLSPEHDPVSGGKEEKPQE